MSVRKFPIMARDRSQDIPWSMIEPHEDQAQKNHYQTLERLAQRGGLAPCEAVAILEDRPWHKMDSANAQAQLAALVLEAMP